MEVRTTTVHGTRSEVAALPVASACLLLAGVMLVPVLPIRRRRPGRCLCGYDLAGLNGEPLPGMRRADPRGRAGIGSAVRGPIHSSRRRFAAYLEKRRRATAEERIAERSEPEDARNARPRKRSFERLFVAFWGYLLGRRLRVVARWGR